MNSGPGQRRRLLPLLRLIYRIYFHFYEGKVLETKTDHKWGPGVYRTINYNYGKKLMGNTHNKQVITPTYQGVKVVPETIHNLLTHFLPLPQYTFRPLSLIPVGLRNIFFSNYSQTNILIYSSSFRRLLLWRLTLRQSRLRHLRVDCH